METKSSRKAHKKSATIAPAASLQLAYVEYLLNEGKRPPSIYKFTHDLGLNEGDFYDHFGSFDALDQFIWKGFIDRTLVRLNADTAYTGFSIREKILAFYYTFFEDLKSNRSFVLLQLERQPKLELVPGFLKDFKAAYEAYINHLLAEGRTTGEVANRPYIEQTYGQISWMQMAFLLIFWKKDNSPGFEQTDAAIEKSVNLMLDLFGKGAVDTAFDFAKFLFQKK